MARGGKKAPRAARGGSRQQTQDFAPTTFTLQDEARNTTHGGWDRNTRLRDRPVSFVSGGLVEPLEIPAIMSEDQAEGKPPLAQAALVAAPPGLLAEAVFQAKERSNLLEPRPTADIDSPDHSSQLETAEALPLVPGPPITLQVGSVPAAYLSETHDSDSSDEVILFKGRGTALRDAAAPDLSLDEIRREITFVETSLSKKRDRDSSSQISETIPRASAPQVDLDHLDDTSEGHDAIDDYLANVLDHDLQHHGEMNSRELGGMGDDDFLEQGIDNLRILANTARARGDSHNFQTIRRESRHETVAITATGSLDGTLDQVQQSWTIDDDADPMEEAQPQHHEEPEDPDFPDDVLSQYINTNIITTAPDDFDFMDWNRPSLQRKRRPKNQGPLFNLSDSELEAQLSAAWQGDRQRKMDRKRAREELRAQGLLGKNANPDDPRVKYPAGMNLEDIETEIKTFLLSSETQLILSPMDANARKAVHQLANRLKLKSKSTGSGDQRRPALYRTKQTPKYAASSVEEAISRSSRRYFPRMDVKSGGAKRQAGGIGRAHHGGATVRDGEVVGGSAPEIGAANKGRAILEKLGWTHGQALGAMDNKGIIQPIEHVVKRSKAGLGGL